MAWTTPLNWTTDQVVTEADLDTYVSANTLYLKDLFDGVQTQSWTPRYAAGDAVGHSFVQRKARGSLASPTIVSASDSLGTRGWAGYDGSAYREAVQLKAFVDGTPGASDMPGALSILTTTDGGITLTERIRIMQDGLKVNNLMPLSGTLIQIGDDGLAINNNNNSGAALSVAQNVSAAAFSVASFDGPTVVVNTHGTLTVDNHVGVSNNLAVGDLTSIDAASAGGFGGAGTGILRMANATAPGSSPPSGMGLFWYDDAAGALKVKTDTGATRQMLHAGARVFHNTTQSLTSGSATALLFNSERYDTDSFHDTTTNTSRLTIPTGRGGKYLMGGHIGWAGNATGRRDVSIRLNGSTLIAAFNTVPPDGTAFVSEPIVTVYDLAAGDYVELVATQASGGALSTVSNGNYCCEFWLACVG